MDKNFLLHRDVWLHQEEKISIFQLLKWLNEYFSGEGVWLSTGRGDSRPTFMAPPATVSKPRLLFKTTWEKKYLLLIPGFQVVSIHLNEMLLFSSVWEVLEMWLSFLLDRNARSHPSVLRVSSPWHEKRTGWERVVAMLLDIPLQFYRSIWGQRACQSCLGRALLFFLALCEESYATAIVGRACSLWGVQWINDSFNEHSKHFFTSQYKIIFWEICKIGKKIIKWLI